jgi:hypothetical protein
MPELRRAPRIGDDPEMRTVASPTRRDAHAGARVLASIVAPGLAAFHAIACGASEGKQSGGGAGSGGSVSGGAGGASGGAGGSSGSGGASGGSGRAGAGGGGASSGSSGTGGTAGTSDSGGASGMAGAAGEGPACPGVAPRADEPGRTCRSSDDCTNGASCESDFSPGCGALLPAQRLCELDGDCASGSRCVEATVQQPCEDGLAASCVPECSADSCGDGDRCTDGICEPLPCTEGFDCDGLYVCMPGRPGADRHGCAPRNCNEGYECEAGYSCDAGTGRCNAVHCRQGGAAACPINQLCDDGSAGRGCLPKPCEEDGDCDCGACIHRCTGLGCPPGECAPRLYLCVLAVP